MYDLTAAHPTLPLGSWVRVTNLHNGRAVYVRINDRGPIIPGRIIDLSFGAARALSFRNKGLQRVRLDLASLKKPLPCKQWLISRNRFTLPKDARPRQRLIVALDVPTAAAAQKIVAAVGYPRRSIKLGCSCLRPKARKWCGTWFCRDGGSSSILNITTFQIPWRRL